MRNWGAIALFGMLMGTVAMAPGAEAQEAPAFVGATMCDVAAPIASGATIFSRKVRAERPAAQARRQAPAARPAPGKPVEPVAQPQEEPAEAEAVLYPAVHFCVSPAGANRPVRYT